MASRGQPDEIDMIVIAPGGVVVIEVKHWDRSRLKGNAWEVEEHADLITLKAKRVAGRLRQVQPKLDFIPAKMLLTKEAKSLRQSGRLPRSVACACTASAILTPCLSRSLTRRGSPSMWSVWRAL